MKHGVFLVSASLLFPMLAACGGSVSAECQELAEEAWFQSGIATNWGTQYSIRVGDGRLVGAERDRIWGLIEEQRAKSEVATGALEQECGADTAEELLTQLQDERGVYSFNTTPEWAE